MIRDVVRRFLWSLDLGFVNKLMEVYLVVEAMVCTMWCRWHYARCLSRLQKKPKDEKLRVLFIVSEPAKWKCQTLLEAMDRSGKFETLVGLSAWNCESDMDDDTLDEHLAKTEAFFDRLGDRHVRTVKTHPRSFVDLRTFRPDIVFYNEQWRPCFPQHPVVVSKFALTFFIPYYVPVFGNMFIHCRQPVEQLSYVYFTLNDEWTKLFAPYFKHYSSTAKLVALGYPALDSFAQGADHEAKKNYVIFAPHFAIPKKDGKNDWQITQSTFDWSGRQVLAYAKKHPEFNWVFKPHPLLKTKLMEVGFMTKDELDDYYAEWERVGQIYLGGDYQSIFLESRVMLTDSGSFLAEYGATGLPLIHLWCPQNTVEVPRPTKMLMDTFYRVTTEKELDAALKMLLEEKCDPKREERQRVVRELGLCANNASENIVDYLSERLKR